MMAMHGEDDRVEPFELSGKTFVGLLQNCALKIPPRVPRGMPRTEAGRINKDLLEPIRS